MLVIKEGKLVIISHDVSPDLAVLVWCIRRLKHSGISEKAILAGLKRLKRKKPPVRSSSRSARKRFGGK